MDRVRRKQHKSRAGKGLLFALLFALVAALCLALNLLTRTPVAASNDEHSVIKQTRLFTCATDQVRTISITPPQGENYTLTYTDGKLGLATDPDYPIRETIASLILSNAANIIAEDTIVDTSATIVDLAPFGLDVPVCTAQVTYTDGTVNTLRLGSQMTTGIPYYYFMWNDDPHIYAVSTDVYDAFSYPFASLHTVTQPTWDASLWDSVTISGENNRSIHLTDMGWQMTEPFAYPLDTTAVEAFLANVADIRFAQYVGQADALDLAVYGLEEPRLTLTLHQVESLVSFLDEEGSTTSTVVLPAEDIVLHCGASLDEYYFYVEYLGTVYTATEFQLGFLWNEDVENLLLSHPANADITALNQLTVETSDMAVTYDIHLLEQLEQNGDLKLDEDGNVLCDVVVQKDSTAIDSDAFLLWYAQLRQLTHEGKLTESVQPTGSPRVQFVLKCTDHTRTIALYPYDALYDMLAVDGTALYYLPKTALNDLMTLP